MVKVFIGEKVVFEGAPSEVKVFVDMAIEHGIVDKDEEWEIESARYDLGLGGFYLELGG